LGESLLVCNHDMGKNPLLRAKSAKIRIEKLDRIALYHI